MYNAYIYVQNFDITQGIETCHCYVLSILYVYKKTPNVSHLNTLHWEFPISYLFYFFISAIHWSMYRFASLAERL